MPRPPTTIITEFLRDTHPDGPVEQVWKAGRSDGPVFMSVVRHFKDGRPTTHQYWRLDKPPFETRYAAWCAIVNFRGELVNWRVFDA